MNRRKFLYATASGASVIGLSGCSMVDTNPNDNENNNNQTDDQNNQDDNNQDDNIQGIQNGSFESGLDKWRTGKDVPDIPGGSEPVDNEVSITSEVSSDGDKAVSFYIEGLADDGTVWVEQDVDLTSYDTFKIDVYSEMKSFNILSEVAFFAGEKPSEGLSEIDFNRDNDVQDHEGWKTYEYDVSELIGEKTVAIGMNVIWETGITSIFDNARLE